MIACSVPEIHCTRKNVTDRGGGGGIGYSRKWIIEALTILIEKKSIEGYLITIETKIITIGIIIIVIIWISPNATQ